MHPHIHATQAPDRPAYIMADTDEIITYKELDDRSNRAAQLFRSYGLRRGDMIVLFLENHARFFELCWAAQRSGLYFTPISSRLSSSEVDYILKDAKPRLFFTSDYLIDVARKVDELGNGSIKAFTVDATEQSGFQNYIAERDLWPAEPIADQSCGVDMLYSSGTTGKPKGVRVPLPEGDIAHVGKRWTRYKTVMGFNEESVHLLPLPLYHAMPLHHAIVAQNYGGTVLVHQKFDAEDALKCIEKYRVTHAAWVATMFIRMLKLPEDVRSSYNISSMSSMVHGAGPCPIPIKERMIDWFGPIIYEAYGSTEGFGSAAISSEEWLKHKGSVGKPGEGAIHIVNDETGEELPAGERGTIYFESPRKVEYLNDQSKTESVMHAKGWATAGDIGYVDEDGYLYLTDRTSDMIISGGVNIYPRETENLLIMHPKVADVAVFGIPNEDFGEEVKAVVQLANPREAGEELEAELIQYCKDNLSILKSPKSVDFLEQLPRHETGKLYKRLLRETYWKDQ